MKELPMISGLSRIENIAYVIVWNDLIRCLDELYGTPFEK